MTKRNNLFYYTDPLAAAWMAKHFGMMFGINHYGKIVWDCETQGATGEWSPIRDWEHIAADAADGDAQPAYYIHPDSLHLLDPKEWDMGQRMRGVPVVICSDQNYAEFERAGIGRNYVALGDPLFDSHFRIIQRNGLPFFWPEMEGA